MNNIQLSVVHRLPQSYRWSSGFTGVKVEPLASFVGTEEDNNLVGIKLLSHQGQDAWQIMHKLNQHLQEIQVESAVVEWEKEPCLFVHIHDESTAMCHLKNVGVAIAEPVIALYPF